MNDLERIAKQNHRQKDTRPAKDAALSGEIKTGDLAEAVLRHEDEWSPEAREAAAKARKGFVSPSSEEGQKLLRERQERIKSGTEPKERSVKEIVAEQKAKKASK